MIKEKPLEDITMIYRQEHPKPQFMRESWQNLNGIWKFEKDHSVSGDKRGLMDPDAEFSLDINVPFCMESKLSGIGDVDFVNSVWYKRDIEITKENLENLVFLHFGAVDYEAIVYVNGEKAGTHKGGYVSFKLDITKFLKEGKNTVTLNARDDSRDRLIPSGKQSKLYESYSCFYTRTTGIWQTVWLEFVPKTHISKTKYYTDIHAGTVTVNADLVGEGTFKAEAFYEGKPMGSAETVSFGGNTTVQIKLAEKHLWEVGNGRLYDLVLTYGDDKVSSYFGLRSIRLSGRKFLINEKSVFQRLVLDQGFYPDGIYTAPSDAELIADIDRSLAMGFNGARLHEKVFEERFLYHADRKGYIVWGEHANWGLDHSYADSIHGFLPEWLEAIDRDFNHPAIIGWCPMNETWNQQGRKQSDDVIKNIYLATKAADNTRPCIDSSGGVHVMTDIMDDHSYEQDPAKFKEHYADVKEKGEFVDRWEKFHKPYKSRLYNTEIPFFCSEYGGIGWDPNIRGDHKHEEIRSYDWSYGEAPKTQAEFLARLKGLTDVLMDNDAMFALCYTQLTDVEQEKNGLYTYDRKPKFDPELVYPIFARKAAIED